MPRMLEAGEPGHVVITASVGGLISGGLLGPYTTSKYGAVAIAESLYRELDIIGAPIGVSCLCPGAVATGIFRAERNRPDTYEDTCGPMSADAEAAAFHKALINAIDEGTDPTEIPELVFDAVRSDKFWIFPHPRIQREDRRPHPVDHQRDQSRVRGGVAQRADAVSVAPALTAYW